MRTGFRTLTVWTIVASLTGGLLLPLFATAAVADPDGACGPVLILAHSIDHFEAPLQAPDDHCALCHLWNTMATASVSDRAHVSAPDDAVRDAGRGSPDRAYHFDFTQAPPRGPPSLS